MFVYNGWKIFLYTTTSWILWINWKSFCWFSFQQPILVQTTNQKWVKNGSAWHRLQACHKYIGWINYFFRSMVCCCHDSMLIVFLFTFFGTVGFLSCWISPFSHQYPLFLHSVNSVQNVYHLIASNFPTFSKIDVESNPVCILSTDTAASSRN